MALSRDQVLLVMLSLADGDPFTPVQVQKSLFLANDKVPGAFRRDSTYEFQPYDYGPFDRQVYADAEDLGRHGYVRIGTDERGRWNTYMATGEGRQRAEELRNALDDHQVIMLRRIVEFVRSLSFYDLVSAIYRGYPEMRKNSVFRS